MKIITNNCPRPILSSYELTKKELNEFDYLTEEEIESRSFFRYRGEVYDLGEFMRTPNSVKGWDGYLNETFFSSIVVKFFEEDQIIAGRLLA